MACPCDMSYWPSFYERERIATLTVGEFPTPFSFAKTDVSTYRYLYESKVYCSLHRGVVFNLYMMAYWDFYLRKKFGRSALGVYMLNYLATLKFPCPRPRRLNNSTFCHLFRYNMFPLTIYVSSQGSPCGSKTLLSMVMLPYSSFKKYCLPLTIDGNGISYDCVDLYMLCY